MLEVSGAPVGAEPSENPPRLRRVMLPLVGGEIERHVIAVTGALARATHAEVTLVAADAAPTRGVTPARRLSFGGRPVVPTLHAASRNLARHEAALRGRGVRVRSYLVRGGPDTLGHLGRVAAQEHVDMVVLATGSRAAPSVPQAARAALAMGVPTLLIGAASASPWTQDVLRRASVVVPTITGEHTTEGLLWAETLAKCCDGAIILLRMSHQGDLTARASAAYPTAPAANGQLRAAEVERPRRATWPASGVAIRWEEIADFGKALAQLRLHAPALVVLPLALAQIEDPAIQSILHTLDETGVLTLIIPCGVQPPPGTGETELAATQASEEACHDATALT